MTRCLKDEALFMLREGDGTDEQRSHLESCEVCGERYKRMARDLDLIKNALQQEPPPARLQSYRIPLSYRWIPAAAALVVAIMLVWGESRLWKRNSSAPPEQVFNSDLSQFLDEVSDAVFAGANVRAASAAAPDSDFNFLQVALGESCSDECEEVYSNPAYEPAASSPKERTGHSGEPRDQKKTE